MIGPVTLVRLSMSHLIHNNRIIKGSSTGGIVLGNIHNSRIIKGSSTGGIVLGNVHNSRIIKGSSTGGIVLGNVHNSRIIKGSSTGGIVLNINSTIHSAIKDSKNYDLALMVAAYHFLIKPIF